MNYSKKQIEFVGVRLVTKKVKDAFINIWLEDRYSPWTAQYVNQDRDGLKRQSLLALDWIIRECHLYIAF